MFPFDLLNIREKDANFRCIYSERNLVLTVLTCLSLVTPELVYEEKRPGHHFISEASFRYQFFVGLILLLSLFYYPKY